MTTIPLVTSDWRRFTPEEPVLAVRNRFFEKNPSNFQEGSSLILRPGFERFVDLGVNTTFSMYVSQGLFDNDFFVMTDEGVFRVNSSGTSEKIIDTVVDNPYSINNKATFTAPIGNIPGYFYIVLDGNLWVYAEQSFSHNILTATPNENAIEEGAVVRIGNMYYEFTSGGVDVGTPDGSSGNPWLVDRSSFAFFNLLYAVNTTPNFRGTSYSSATVRNPDVVATDSPTSQTIIFLASEAGVGGNGIPVGVSSTTVLSWASSSFFGGGVAGDPDYSSYVIQDEVQASYNYLGTLGSYVIMATSDLLSPPGTFYWLNPGETQPDPLDFATAEMSPDSLVSLRVVGEYLWLLGTDTCEVWYLTGDANNPFARSRGQSINIGCISGSDQVIANSLIFAGKDYKVRVISGSSASVISDNGIEERIRRYVQNDVENSIRSWTTFTDGHLFYIINLGLTETLVYDMTTEQWMNWGTGDSTYLIPSCGITYLTPVVPASPNTFLALAADFSSGQIWRFTPDYRLDDIPGSETESTMIQCAITAGVPMRMRETVKCNEVYLTGSVGNPVLELFYLVDGDNVPLVDADGYQLTDYNVTGVAEVDGPNSAHLEYSDDNGKTWTWADQVEVMPESYNQELVWRSLGVIHAPGRIFRFWDYGALHRIDGLDIR